MYANIRTLKPLFSRGELCFENWSERRSLAWRRGRMLPIWQGSTRIRPLHRNQISKTSYSETEPRWLRRAYTQAQKKNICTAPNAKLLNQVWPMRAHVHGFSGELNPLRATPGVKNHNSTDPSEALVHGLAAEYPNPSLDWLAVMSRVAYARLG